MLDTLFFFFKKKGDLKIESWVFIISYSVEVFVVSPVLCYSLGNYLEYVVCGSQKTFWISLIIGLQIASWHCSK